MAYRNLDDKRAYAAKYRATYGHAYSKEKMREYNRVYNARKKGIDPETYRIRGEIPTTERILENCIPEPNSGCWLWLKRLDKDGYGHISVNGTVMSAPRASFMAFRGGPSDPAVLIRHTCDFPPCVNPDHLLVGDHTANSNDRVLRGRDAKKGLTIAKVSEIRRRHARGEMVSSLSATFAVSTFVVWQVVGRKSWRRLP